MLRSVACVTNHETNLLLVTVNDTFSELYKETMAKGTLSHGGSMSSIHSHNRAAQSYDEMCACVHNDLDYDMLALSDTVLCQSQVHPAKMVSLNTCSALAVL